MKDLKFRGVISGVDIDVTFRTDLIHEDAENFSIMQIQTGDTFSPNDIKDEQIAKLDAGFKQLPSNLTAFKAFATDNSLDLYIMNTDGSEKTVLVNGDESISETV